MTKKEKMNIFKGLAFISPWIIGFLTFTVYPVIMSFYYSFCDYSVFEKPLLIGFDNYIDLLFDKIFWISLGNTLYFAALSIPLGLIVAFIIALLLNAKVRCMAVYRTFFFMPTLVPIVASAVLWMWILNGQYGLLNNFLEWIGLKGPNWLQDKYWVIPALVVMGLWGLGRTIVILLAGLQEVPQSLYEASEIDGANYIQRIFNVTIPMVSPIIYFNVIMGIIGCLQVFSEPFIMTGGGPGRASTFYSFYLYQKAFEDYNMGYASAMAWILFIVILVLTLIANQISKRFVFYRGGD
ncbi:MAG: sugar ABC transporter permease [Candidatus Hydrogenedentota bacterium]